MARKSLLQVYCDAVRGDSKIDESSILRLYARSIASLDTYGVAGTLRERLATALDETLEAHLGICKTTSPDFNPVQTHARGGKGLLWYFARRRVALEQLEALIVQIEQPRNRADGYAPRELVREADIGRSTWQSITKMTRIQIKPGDSSRRMSNDEIQQLITAARQYGKRKGEAAAIAWEKLLARNLQ